MKRKSKFKEHFVQYCDNSSYSCNSHTYNPLGHSLFVVMTNYTFVKYSIAPQAYKDVNTHANEISSWQISSRTIHQCAPNIGRMNGDIKYDIETLSLKNGEQLEDFHSRILILKQEIVFYGKTVFLTRILFHYMKALSKSKTFKAFITPKMTYLITVLDNNENQLYTRG